MRLRLIPCRSATAVIEAPGCDASSRIATFSSIVQRRRRVTVLMISTRLSITVLMTGHKDAKTHDSPSAPQGSRQTTLTLRWWRRHHSELAQSSEVVGNATLLDDFAIH